MIPETAPESITTLVDDWRPLESTADRPAPEVLSLYRSGLDVPPEYLPQVELEAPMYYDDWREL